MTREETLNSILDKHGNDLIICSLGKMGRELYELRKKRGEPNEDMILQGSMGCAIGVGLGVALNTDKQVVVLIGDGALLMKLGSLSTIYKYALKNLKIKVLNNHCYDSTGGQKTSFDVKTIMHLKDYGCEIYCVERGCRKDLGRPDITCEQIKNNFMAKVRR